MQIMPADTKFGPEI